MPNITGIAGSNVAPPRETKPQRATEPTRESQRPANLSRPKDGEATTADQQAARPEPGKSASAKSASSSFQARLNYDAASEDIFIEIIGPRTGEILQRLPPKNAIEPLLQATDGKAGTVLDLLT